MKAAIIGGGNIGLALAEGLVQAGNCYRGDIIITRRNAAALTDLKKKGFGVNTNNAEAITGADAVFICVLPQQLNEALAQLKPSINLEKQLVVSGGYRCAYKCVSRTIRPTVTHHQGYAQHGYEGGRKHDLPGGGKCYARRL